jgi:hypothetical protein
LTLLRAILKNDSEISNALGQTSVLGGPHNALQDAESVGLSHYFLAVAALIADTGRYRGYFESPRGALLTGTVLSKEPFAGAVVGTWATAFFFFIYGVENFKVNAIRYLKSTYLGIAAFILLLCVYMVPHKIDEGVHPVDGQLCSDVSRFRHIVLCAARTLETVHTIERTVGANSIHQFAVL